VKIAISSLLMVTLMTVLGCQTANKPTDSAALDLNSGTAASNYNPSPTPVAYAPPIQDSSMTSSTPAMSAAPLGNSYTIKPGDTLWKIAATHYGDGRKWKQITDANPGLEPSKLRVGQTITLP
jgi:nucleoid-associated protein YgaU